MIDTHTWLSKLVSFDTTSKHSNLALIQCISDYFDSLGVQYWLSKNPEGNKANLFATLPATDGSIQGGLVLSGHTDVVPVTNQIWDTDPFVLTERNGRLYGRGTCDMKGFIAVCLALTPELIAMPRTKPIHFAFSFDEEIGCMGAPYMITELQKRGIEPEGCVVGEPTSMKIVVAHKGINAFQCKVHGKSAHSSLTPYGCNAIEYAAEMITHLRHMAHQLKTEGLYDEFYDVPFSTMTVNRIQGGIAINTIPDTCEFSYEYRNLPGIPAQTIQTQIQEYVNTVLLPKMQSEYPEASIELHKIASAPGLDAMEQAAIVQLVRTLTKDAEIRKVAYGTEAGLFALAGIPSIVCGPGSINHAHKPNEYIEPEQLEQCEKFVRQLAQSLG